MAKDKKPAYRGVAIPTDSLTDVRLTAFETIGGGNYASEARTLLTIALKGVDSHAEFLADHLSIETKQKLAKGIGEVLESGVTLALLKGLPPEDRDLIIKTSLDEQTTDILPYALVLVVEAWNKTAKSKGVAHG